MISAMDLLLGLLRPQEGQILADGVEIQADYSVWLSRLGYIPQTVNFTISKTVSIVPDYNRYHWGWLT